MIEKICWSAAERLLEACEIQCTVAKMSYLAGQMELELHLEHVSRSYELYKSIRKEIIPAEGRLSVRHIAG